jgi:hypothetical protein
MLDVHPPHEKTHTWTDFFIHIATICVGLLIAIALEQTVEAIHRHHERAELLEALDRESEQIIRDGDACAARDAAKLLWLKHTTEAIRSNLVDHTPYTGLTSVSYPHADSPSDPIYKTARASGKLALLSDREVAAYGELDDVLVDLGKHIDRLQTVVSDETDRSRVVNLHRSKDNPAIYTAVPEDDLKQLYVSLGQNTLLEDEIYGWNRAASGAAAALLKGERDLRKIQLAERPDSVPQVPR